VQQVTPEQILQFLGIEDSVLLRPPQ
jgi:hypothetical protein